MKSIQLGCEFCNDLRYITPAGYVSCKDSSINNTLKKLHEEKKFLYDGYDSFSVIESCPKCGYVFTGEDYDDYFDY